MTLVVQADAGAANLTAAIRREVRALDAGVPVYQVRTLDRLVAASVAAPRYRSLVLASFAALAVLLAAVGVYGVVSHLVSQRRREIGVRLALGARGASIVGMLARQGMLPVCAGIALGLAAAAPLGRLLGRFLFGVSPADPWTYVAAASLLALTALVATVAPSIRTLRIDPLSVLRAD
jgi:ABC-type antimicrobial peptide transport system permease subunit